MSIAAQAQPWRRDRQRRDRQRRCRLACRYVGFCGCLQESERFYVPGRRYALPCGDRSPSWWPAIAFGLPCS